MSTFCKRSGRSTYEPLCFWEERCQPEEFMTIFDVINLAGGIALFLYGMSIMGSGLEKIAGGKMESIFKKRLSDSQNVRYFRLHLIPAAFSAVTDGSAADLLHRLRNGNAGKSAHLINQPELIRLFLSAL